MNYIIMFLSFSIIKIYAYAELFNFEKKEVYMKAKEITWDAIHVTNAIVKSIELIKPSPQVIVGTDGKYFFKT